MPSAAHPIAEDTACIVRLDWAHTPTKKEITEGHAVCQITKARHDREMRPSPHLTRTVEIAPRKSRAESTDVGAQGVGGKLQHITVSESDFRRCGSNLQELRGCQIPSWEERRRREPSFKNSFEKHCRSKVPLRDEWRHVPNPEKSRNLSENDLILNQHLPQSPRKQEAKLQFDLDFVWALQRKTQAASRPSTTSTKPGSRRNSWSEGQSSSSNVSVGSRSSSTLSRAWGECSFGQRPH